MTPQTLTRIHAAVRPQADEAAYIAMYENIARRNARMTMNYLAHSIVCRAGGDLESAKVWDDMARVCDDKHSMALDLILCAKTGGVL